MLSKKKPIKSVEKEKIVMYIRIVLTHVETYFQGLKQCLIHIFDNLGTNYYWRKANSKDGQ